MKKKIYRYNEDNDTWENVSKLIFPDGTVMDEDNYNFERDGYFWSEEPPAEYLEWKAKQDELV